MNRIISNAKKSRRFNSTSDTTNMIKTLSPTGPVVRMQKPEQNSETRNSVFQKDDRIMINNPISKLHGLSENTNAQQPLNLFGKIDTKNPFYNIGNNQTSAGGSNIFGGTVNNVFNQQPNNPFCVNSTNPFGEIKKNNGIFSTANNPPINSGIFSRAETQNQQSNAAIFTNSPANFVSSGIIKTNPVNVRTDSNNPCNVKIDNDNPFNVKTDSANPFNAGCSNAAVRQIKTDNAPCVANCATFDHRVVLYNLMKGETPPISYINRIVNDFKEKMSDRPVFVFERPERPVVIIGSMFGFVQTLQNCVAPYVNDILSNNGAIVFLGDYTGFGENGINVILSVMLMRIMSDSVICLRGKHETPISNCINLDDTCGFQQECVNKYANHGVEVYNTIASAYQYFSICARLNNTFMMNGCLTEYGLSGQMLNFMKNGKLPCTLDQAGIQMIWNSTNLREGTFASPYYLFPIYGNPPTTPKMIGRDLVSEFMRRFDLDSFITSGEILGKNYICGNGKCIRMLQSSFHAGPTYYGWIYLIYQATAELGIVRTNIDVKQSI